MVNHKPNWASKLLQKLALHLMKNRKLDKRKTLEISLRISRTHWRTFWRMKGVRSRRCSPWSQWWRCSNRTSIMKHWIASLLVPQLLLAKVNSQQLHQVAGVKHSCSRWWRVKPQWRQVRPKRILRPSRIAIHLRPQPAPCSMTFSASRQKKNKICNRLRAIIQKARLAQICHLVWAKATSII